MVAHGRNPCPQLADLLIALVAVANELPLVSRNAADLAGLSDLYMSWRSDRPSSAAPAVPGSLTVMFMQVS